MDKHVSPSSSYFPPDWDTEWLNHLFKASSYKYEILHAAAPRMNLFKHPPDPALLLLTYPWLSLSLGRNSEPRIPSDLTRPLGTICWSHGILLFGSFSLQGLDPCCSLCPQCSFHGCFLHLLQGCQMSLLRASYPSRPPTLAWSLSHHFLDFLYSIYHYLISPFLLA